MQTINYIFLYKNIHCRGFISVIVFEFASLFDIKINTQDLQEDTNIHVKGHEVNIYK